MSMIDREHNQGSGIAPCEPDGPVPVLSQLPLDSEAEGARQCPDTWRAYLERTVPPLVLNSTAPQSSPSAILPYETEIIRHALGKGLNDRYSERALALKIPFPVLTSHDPLPPEISADLPLPKVLSADLWGATFQVPIPMTNPPLKRDVHIAGQRSTINAIQKLISGDPTIQPRPDPDFPAFVAAHLDKIRTLALVPPESLLQSFLEYHGIPVAVHQSQKRTILVVGTTAEVLKKTQPVGLLRSW
jgi:hypothetical protein